MSSSRAFTGTEAIGGLAAYVGGRMELTRCAAVRSKALSGFCRRSHVRSSPSFRTFRAPVRLQLCSRAINIIIILLVLSLLGVAFAAASAEPANDGRRRSVAKCDAAQFRVIVDVGHTAEAHGAMSARGVPEYEFNLRLAKLIERDLIEAGFRKTMLLITEGSAAKGLLKRATVANNARANLFLSIHHDSVPDSLLEDWEYDGRPSHFSDKFPGHSIFVSYRNGSAKLSRLFGTLLGRQLKNRGLTYTRHYTEAMMGNRRRQLLDADVGVYRYDQLVVLRTTRMPAVLLEAGSIISRDEELLLNSAGHQALIGAAVTEAVETFCAARLPTAAIGTLGKRLRCRQDRASACSTAAE